MALFNIVAAVVCQHTPSTAARVVLSLSLGALLLALFLPTAYSGGLRSIEAHIHLDPECAARLSHPEWRDSAITHSGTGDEAAAPLGSANGDAGRAAEPLLPGAYPRLRSESACRHPARDSVETRRMRRYHLRQRRWQRRRERALP